MRDFREYQKGLEPIPLWKYYKSRGLGASWICEGIACMVFLVSVVDGCKALVLAAQVRKRAVVVDLSNLVYNVESCNKFFSVF